MTSSSCSAFLVLVLSISIAVNVAHPDTHYVSKTGLDTPPYTSWETAALSIQAAIDAASEGDTVLIGPGTFWENIAMKSGVALKGSASHATIVGEAEGTAATFAGVTGASIEKLAIACTGPKGRRRGRGIEIQDSTDILIRDCLVKRNEAKDGPGAGVHIFRSAVAIEKSLVEENIGTYLGGGICALDSDLSIDGCVITGNRCREWGSGPGGGSGGGVCAVRSGVAIVGSAIVKNNADWGGGGVFLGWSGKPFRLAGCEIIGNTALEGPGGGIASYCLGEITDCVVANNRGGLDGGGIWCGENVAINRCTIANNTTGGYRYEGDGGGIYHRGGPGAAIVNCVVANNAARYGLGPGIYWEASANVVNCTIVDNVPSSGGGIAVQYPAEIYGTYENIVNSIITGDLRACHATYSAVRGKLERMARHNTSSYAVRFALMDSPTVASANWDPSQDTTIFTFEQPFGIENEYRNMFAGVVYLDSGVHWKQHGTFLIAGNAGRTLWCYGYALPSRYTSLSLKLTGYSLVEDSACIDAGNNEAEYLPDEDKAGNFRVWRGGDEWRVDMGAYEFGSRRFEIAAAEPTAESGHLKLTWNSQNLPDKNYSVYLSPDLVTWTLAGSNIPSQGASTSWIDPTANLFPMRFYRVSCP